MKPQFFECKEGVSALVSADDTNRLILPEQSDYECELFGAGRMGIVIRPLKGQEPNWFWRWMQFLILGNRWKKISKGSFFYNKPS